MVMPQRWWGRIRLTWSWFTPQIEATKVSLSDARNGVVDLVHLPNYGVAMEAYYKLHGIGDRIRVFERSNMNFGVAAAEFVEHHRLNP